MKKKIMLIVVIIFIGLIIISLCNELQENKKVDHSFQLPKIAEDEILENVNKMPNDKECFLLSDLLDTGNWKEISLPINDGERKKLESISDDWEISYDKGVNVSVENHQIADGRYSFNKLTVSDGFFLNVCTLEWGGAVYFYPNGDRTKRYKVIDGYIWSFYKMNNENFALEALRFDKTPDGKSLKLKKSFGKWRSVEITKTDGIPFCSTFIDSKTMLLVTENKMIKLINNNIKEIVIDDAFWGGLSPNSAVYDKGYIYIGMRGGIAKINIVSKKIQFFTQKKN